MATDHTRDQDFTRLDEQMLTWGSRLRDDLRIEPGDSQRIASAIAREVQSLSLDDRSAVVSAGNVTLSDRLAELSAFQTFMDTLRSAAIPPHPAVVRAQVLVQNYICFVYLGDSCFRVLRKAVPSGTTKKCCTFLTSNPVRAFRNALAHANWRYLPDCSGLEFWARKGDDPTEALSRFVVHDRDLGFWQALARTTAYVTYLTCKGAREP